MRVQIVENNVPLSIRTVSQQFVHKIQKLPSSTPGIVAGFHLSGGDIQCCKQRRRPMSLVAMAETIHGLAIGQSKIALRALQGLDVRLFRRLRTGCVYSGVTDALNSQGEQFGDERLISACASLPRKADA
jgi:hypothetical protein